MSAAAADPDAGLRSAGWALTAERALEIGERREVLKDCPTSPGCTSPYAPLWIAEMVRRHEAGSVTA